MPTIRGGLFGFDRIDIWRVNSSGLATGQLDPDNLASDTTSHAFEVSGAISAELPGANFGTFEFRGGGAFEGKADSGLENLSDGTIQASQADIALAVLLAGGNQDTTTITGGPIIWSTNDLNPSPVQVGMMLTRKVQSRVSGSAGINSYATVIYPLVQMRLINANFSQEAGVNVGAVTLSVKPQVASKMPWGEAFSSTQGWYNNNNIWFGIRSDKPWALTTWIADGIAVIFTTQYRPTNADAASGRGNNLLAINGTPTAPTTFATATGLVTVAAAGSDLDIHHAFYQTSHVTP